MSFPKNEIEELMMRELRDILISILFSLKAIFQVIGFILIFFRNQKLRFVLPVDWHMNLSLFVKCFLFHTNEVI